MSDYDQSTTNLEAAIQYAGLTARETHALLASMPAGSSAVVTRQPVLIGGDRFAADIAHLSAAEVHTIAATLHNHVREVAADKVPF